jgi:DNA-binding protein WhiA
MDSCNIASDNCLETKNKYALLAKSILQKYNLNIFKHNSVLHIEGDNISQLIDDMNTLQLDQQCCQVAYLSSIFLGCGSLSVSSNYQLSILLHSDSVMMYLQQLMSNLGIPPKLLQRTHKYILYLKDSQLIADCLVLMNAVQAVLDFNNILASADIRKQINRATNCISANIDKSLSTSFRHISAIKRLKTTGNFDLLSAQDRNTANARTRHPDYTLQQLADTLKMSKSGVKHRLDKILQINDDLQL